MPVERNRGAYGLRLVGLEDRVADWALDVPHDWPELRLELQAAEEMSQPPGTTFVEENRAELWMTDGDVVHVDRTAMAATYRTRTPLSADALAHPYLGFPAMMASWWLGREVLHAGAFLHGAKAYGVIGAKGGGKSSTLGQLLAWGTAILSDDLLVSDGHHAFAGPRTIDLRGEPSERLGGEALGLLGARGRWRLRPASVPPIVELGGFIHLEWGEELSVSECPVEDRLRRLIEACAFVATRRDELSLLDLMALPAWVVTRPMRLDQLEPATNAMLEVLP